MEIYGESENHVVDERGRIFIPNRFKLFFELGGYLMRAFNGQCLVFHPAESLVKLRERIAAVNEQLNMLDVTKFIQAEMAADDLTRFISCGTPVTLDAQGRLALPPGLRRRAGIEGEVAFIAMGDRLEIWGQERWLAYDAARLSPDALHQTLQSLASSTVE